MTNQHTIETSVNRVYFYRNGEIYNTCTTSLSIHSNLLFIQHKLSELSTHALENENVYAELLDGNGSSKWKYDHKSDKLYEVSVDDDDYRQCSGCKKMIYNEGYVFRSGEHYACSDECRDVVCTDVYQTTWGEEYEDSGESYYTEWED